LIEDIGNQWSWIKQTTTDCGTVVIENVKINDGSIISAE